MDDELKVLRAMRDAASRGPYVTDGPDVLSLAAGACVARCVLAAEETLPDVDAEEQDRRNAAWIVAATRWASAALDAHMTPSPCVSTHHMGCACHEARRDAAFEQVKRERDEAVAEVRRLRAQHAERDAAERVHASAYAGSVARREAAEQERDALRAHLCTVLGWAYDVCDQTIQCPQCNAVWWNQPEEINENWHGPGCEIFAAEVASGRSVDVRRGPVCEEKLRAVIAEEEGYKDHLRATHAEAVANEAMAVGLAEVERLRAIVDGRTTPPTDAELDAHPGEWCFAARSAVGYVDHHRLVSRPRGDREWLRYIERSHRGEGWSCRWWPLDAEHRPCAWPVTP